MIGRMLAADMFQFQLLDAGGAVLQTAANDSEGKVYFTAEYAAAGTYHYTLAERIPANAVNNQLNGVTYDGRTWPVQVTVRDNLAGELVAEVSYPNGAPAFANDYTPAPTTASIGGGKVLDGRSQTAGEFSFALYETDSRFVPLDNVADGTAVTYDTGSGFAFNFGEKTYTEAGGYRYIIVEQKGSDSQIDYDTSVFYALVTVADNGQGQLEAEVTLGNAIDANGTVTSVLNAIEFYNVFHHTPAELTISGSKTLQDHGWEDTHVFNFALYDSDAAFTVAEDAQPVATAANDPTAEGAEGAFTFPKLTFEKEGTYYYVVREQLPAGMDPADPRDETTGIVYDTRAVHVTVTVEEDPADPTALKAAYTVDGAETVSFTNRYTTAGSVLAAISGKKILSGRNIRTADGFQFVLKDHSGNEVETVTVNGDGSANEAAFRFQSLSFDKAGTYTYTVEEVEGTVAGVTYSKEVCTVTVQVGSKLGKLLDPVVTYAFHGDEVEEMTFTNTYKAGASEDLVLEGTKALTGAILQDDQFTFELYTAEMSAEGTFVQSGKLEEVTNTGSKFAFKGLSFEETGTYYYIVKEQPGSTEGVTYDDNEIYVTVSVEDTGDGKLVAEVTQIASKNDTVDEISFTNVYAPDPISITVEGTKILTGRVLEDGEFTFELYETGSDHVISAGAAAMDTAVNVNGKFAFDPVELKTAGVYYFAVREVPGNLSRVTYDTTIYHVTVTVSNVSGVLEKDVTCTVGGEAAEEIVFRNVYRQSGYPTPDPDPTVEVVLPVEKKLNSDAVSLAGFRFELTDHNGSMVDTATSDRSGDGLLHVGTFSKRDAGRTFTYRIREINTGLEGISYSTKEYEVQIAVYYDSSRNRLTYEVVKDGLVVNAAEPFAFTNLVQKEEPQKPVSPDTGDHGVGFWILLMSVGIAGFAATLLAMIKRKRNA